MRKGRIKEVNSFYEAQSDFNKQIMDLNEKESLKFFNNFHESVLNALFIEQDGEKYQKLQNKFDELVDLADAGDVSLFPIQWLDITMKRTTEYYDENLDLKRIIEIYPIIMEFRRTVFELINPKNLTKEEIKEKKDFIKERYNKLTENPSILELFKSYLTTEDYYRNIEFPRAIYTKIMET